ncbi:MAG TPA: hypothetical protein VK186_18345, partial [Candidatus Deferrimicrobium sp.]|nr:hypothetical protein [Candidatus Deferrimicrobium sp.]
AALEAGDSMANLPLVRFEATVVEGMAGLREILGNPTVKTGGAKAQEVFLFAILDFADFIGEYLNNNVSALGSLNSSLFADLGRTKIYWSDVLKKVGESNNKEKILAGVINDLSFILPQQTTANDTYIKEIIKSGIDGLNILTGTYTFSGAFKSQVENALKNSTPSGGAQTGETGTVPEVPKYEAGVSYVLRCVYERPRCKGIHPPVVSQPSRRFQLATYFEPEAPTRPVRIVMPEDTGIAGLRKFKKNVAVLFSDKLRNQIDQIKNAKVKDIDEGNISSEPGFSLGMICSFSIPIITICAMILLMIFVKLLNIVFWWMPFFKICFPIPRKN